MPDFARVPTGWTTDRFDPAGFSNIGNYQGRADVLGISTATAQTLNSRPAPYQSAFYNTQGRGYDLSGGAGSVLAAALYIPLGWASAADGSRRTDMWGVMTDGSSSVTDYPIIGFTNYGGAARFRAWDQDTPGGWIDLTNAVQYGAWNVWRSNSPDRATSIR